MKKFFVIILSSLAAFTIIIMFTASKTESVENNEVAQLPEPVYKYWKSGKAEISNYDLKQYRYGESRQGQAVMIFVTEPFLPETQVKFDGLKTSEKIDEVLKLNINKSFYTGIYRYSIMTSVFTPFQSDSKNPLKITMSSQDWCGQSFLQVNNNYEKFDVKRYSYFQKIADQKFAVDKNIMEDNIWNLIRLNKDSLPAGDIQIIPSAEYLRLYGIKFESTRALAELKLVDKKELSAERIHSYKIDFTELNRTLEVYFENSDERKILGWDETLFESGKRDESVKTQARLSKSIMLDYWNKNRNKDSTYAQKLGLFEINQ